MQNYILRSLQIINHLLVLVGLVYVFVTSQWAWILLGYGVGVVIGLLGVNIGLHRLLSHRSFRTATWVEQLFSIIATLATMGSPLAWAAVHRQHHRGSDTPTDPHSPHQIGSLRTWLQVFPQIKFDPRLIRDLRHDKFQQTLHRYYLWVIFAYISILFVLGGPLVVIFAYCYPACQVFHAASFANVAAHQFGYKNYSRNDESRNNWIVNLFTVGEGWHNNHHEKPYHWRQGEKWWEIDPPAWIIRIIKIDDKTSF